MDVLELMTTIQTNFPKHPRCALFIRPLQVTQTPDAYKKALIIMQEIRYPHYELSEQIFDNLIQSCERESLVQITHSANLQGLPQEQVEQLALMSGYANSSSSSNGFGNSALQIRQLTPQLQQSNAHIQTMILVIHDFNHRYQTYLSDQMRCEKSLGLQLVVPVTMYRPKPRSDSYAPVQMLPPLCDDPSQPHFYVNDCRPVATYLNQLQQIPVPRLVIRGFFLNAEETVVHKNEDLLKVAQDLAQQYQIGEQVMQIAASHLCQISYSELLKTLEVYKELSEKIQLIKTGIVKQVQFQQGDFLATSKASAGESSFQQFSSSEMIIRYKDLTKSAEVFVQELIKFLKIVVQQVKAETSRPEERQYLESMVSGIDKPTIVTLLATYYEFYVKNSQVAILDYDELEVLMGQRLCDLVTKRLLAGYFSTTLQPDQDFYDELMTIQVRMHKQFDSYHYQSAKHVTLKPAPAKQHPLL